jgi:hypothetical protein
MLVMFFGLFRKSNLFPNTEDSFSSEKQLSRSSIQLCDDASVVITVKWSKTIQFKERSYEVKLPCIHPHPLCPVTALVKLFNVSGTAPSNAVLFQNPSAGKSKVMTGTAFAGYLKTTLQKAGICGNISSHSVRRGGATWALGCGVPGEVVKLMGDWKSLEM